jgi:hypothetical protein
VAASQNHHGRKGLAVKWPRTPNIQHRTPNAEIRTFGQPMLGSFGGASNGGWEKSQPPVARILDHSDHGRIKACFKIVG